MCLHSIKWTCEAQKGIRCCCLPLPIQIRKRLKDSFAQNYPYHNISFRVQSFIYLYQIWFFFLVPFWSLNLFLLGASLFVHASPYDFNTLSVTAKSWLWEFKVLRILTVLKTTACSLSLVFFLSFCSLSFHMVKDQSFKYSIMVRNEPSIVDSCWRI